MDKEEEVPYEYPFLVGKYDLHLLSHVKSKMDSWRQLEEDRKEDFSEFSKFMDSSYLSLYKATHTNISPLTDGAQQMGKILKIAESMIEWQDLKKKVENDYVKSALATMVIGERIVFPKDDSSGSGKKKGGGNADGEEDGEGSGEPKTDPGADSPDATDAIRSALREAIKEANEVAENSNTLATLWGNEIGEDISSNPEALYQLAGHLKDSRRLKLISQLLGRMKNQISRAQMSKVDYVPEEFVDITIGNDLPNLLPSSKMLLADPELETLFLMRYMQRALLQQEKEGYEKLAQGPIIVLVDLSGSMSMGLGEIPSVGSITRIDWAASVALALTLLARSQNREYYLGLFDTRIRHEIRSKEVEVDEIIKLLSVKGSGGTNFEVPLKRGLDILKESVYNKADIVFITDGECQVSPAFLREFHKTKEDKGFKVLGVSCGKGKPFSIEKFSDSTITVSNLLEADTASFEIFKIGD